MIKNPHILHTSTIPAALIRLIIPKDQIRHVMGPGLQELMSIVAAQEAGPAGPWFTHHYKISDEGWDFEIGVPVTKPVVAVGRVVPGEWPAMKAAKAIYQGPYEGLGEAWGEFLDWLEKEGHQPAGDLYECYVAGPESGPDSAQWQTEFTKRILN